MTNLSLEYWNYNWRLFYSLRSRPPSPKRGGRLRRE